MYGGIFSSIWSLRYLYCYPCLNSYTLLVIKLTTTGIVHIKYDPAAFLLAA